MTVKARMLKALAGLSRKVETGEVTGFVVVASTSDDYSITCCVGAEPEPAGILTIGELAATLRSNYLARNETHDDGAPRLRVTDKDPEDTEP